MIRSRQSSRFPAPSLVALAAVVALFAGSSLALFAQIRPPLPLRRSASLALAARPKPLPAAGTAAIRGAWDRSFDLPAGQTVEISVQLERPSGLPDNGRISVEWERVPAGADAPGVPAAVPRPADIPPPSTRWRKVLHALDSSVYVVYRAPVAGRYRLRLAPVTDEAPAGEGTRLREKGSAPALFPVPNRTPWPPGAESPVRFSVRPFDPGGAAEEERLRAAIETEPNDCPEQAQTLALTSGDGIRTWHVTGGADDVEYFDNGRWGKSGDDWFRLEIAGREPRLLTAQLAIPGQVVAARIRCYRLAAKPGEARTVPFGGSLPVEEFTEGRDLNERAHQQDEDHRASICRVVRPGETYFLRVEANAPGYGLQLRVLPPGPYTDPRMAVRQGIYTQIGQVDAWLTNRPRGAAIERRIRDSGNLLGTQCMSCHTQSGVWGPAPAFTRGYQPENVQNYWHLINVMYECLRPTNELKDAANNTSLAPLDLGDGPAGTRAAGFNIVNLERWRKPEKLHASQQIRTANFLLQSSDPGGINAAGPGSNIGQVVVYLFAAEIAKTAWEKTGDPKFFRVLEEKARKVAAVEPKFADDVALRMDFFYRVFPLQQYPAQAARAAEAERSAGKPVKTDPAEVAKLANRARAQLAQDEQRLRDIQNPDGSWSFSPGSTSDGGKSWATTDRTADPSPTALGITALASAGYGPDDPAVAKGVKALLAMQEPNGRWNKAAQTGFVSTAYAIHALSALYPVEPATVRRRDLLPVPGESLLATIERARRAALAAEPGFLDLLLPLARHSSPLVRYWSLIGLGALRSPAGAPALVAGLGDPARMVREAATWGMRQTLLDDTGWDLVFRAYETGDDATREHVMQVLGMRADAVMPQASLDWKRLADIFDRGMNVDAHPAVRAWAAKAAWQWWIWNPLIRSAVNASWVRMLERPEPDALVENSNRYSSQALFIANGHKANGSTQHQYKELARLFELLSARLDEADEDARQRLAARLVGIGATFYTTSGGDGGPGQMGYVTEGAGDLMGKAALLYLNGATRSGDRTAIKVGLEGAANVPYRDLTKFLVDYSLKGPEELRQVAASSVSDARSVMLAAVPELVGPQLEQVRRGAMEPPRRPQVSDPILDLWAKVNWVVPKTDEQQRAFFDLIIPRFQRYASPQELAAMTDAARRAELEREMDAAWYLADRLGEVLEKNPDLHQEIVFREYFPGAFKNPLEEHFWLRSVEWLLTFKARPPAPKSMPAGAPAKGTGSDPAAGRPISLADDPPPAPDPALTIKDRALQLYLDALKPGADPKTRAIAIRMSGKTALRSNPEVLKALSDVLTFEKNEELRKIINNTLKQGSERFMPELTAALKAEKHASIRTTAAGEPAPTRAQVDDILYFRDYVIPEMSRQKRSDQQSCMGCHGQPGRVPSMTLRPPDEFGYLAVADLLADYRILQQRVQMDDLEKSKLLRKPLNIQDGNEDGHQGGRRYGPTDEGYLVLRKWAENQQALQKDAAAAPAMPPGAPASLPPGTPASLPAVQFHPERRQSGFTGSAGILAARSAGILAGRRVPPRSAGILAGRRVPPSSAGILAGRRVPPRSAGILAARGPQRRDRARPESLLGQKCT